METYGMAAPLNDNVIDCYHQYVAQTGYRCERPEDGYYLKAYADNPAELYEAPHHSWYPQRLRNSQRQPATYRSEAQYHSPSRNVFNQNRYNPRNGLYAPVIQRGGGGDPYNSLPGNSTAFFPSTSNPYDMTNTGQGDYHRNSWQHQARSGNSWFLF